MEYVYKTLEKEISALTKQIKECEVIEEKAELIGNKTLLEHSVKLLRKCDENGIYAGSVFTKLPKKKCDSPSSDYRIVEDGETDNPQSWWEVEIESKQDKHVRLGEGDVVIEC